jgi:hypothetical protein
LYEDEDFEVQAESPRETLSAISVRRKTLSFPATMASDRILDLSYPPSTRLPATKGSADPMCMPYDIEGMYPASYAVCNEVFATTV